MLDDKDINKLVSLLATKKDFEEIRSNISDMKELLQGLLVATDAIAKSIGELKMEYAAISTQLTRHERWIKQIAEKVGLNLAME
jgi:predicted  nucleic acid-binding Zn-ribbon protein